MFDFLITPPIAFVVIFIFLLILARFFSMLAFKGGKDSTGKGASYACGEDVKNHMAQPDCSQFFPYAFFFTIAHVAAMMVTTVPMQTVRILVLAIIYVLTVIVGLYILLRR